MTCKLNPASWNHIACMLNFRDRLLVEGVCRNSYIGTNRRGFSGTTANQRAEDLAVIDLFETLFIGRHPDANVLRADIERLRIRQIQVLTNGGNLFKVREAMIQLGLRDLQFRGPVREIEMPAVAAVDAWKAEVRERRGVQGWRHNLEGHTRELEELRRLHGQTSKLLLVCIDWDNYNRTDPSLGNSEAVLKRIRFMQQIRFALPCDFPNVALGSPKMIRDLAFRIRLIWSHLEHIPSRLPNDSRLDVVLRRIGLRNLSLTTLRLGRPYLMPLENGECYEKRRWKEHAIGKAIRAGWMDPFLEMVEFYTRHPDTIEDLSGIIDALLHRKKYDHLRALNGVVTLSGMLGSAAILMVAFKKGWSIEKICKLLSGRYINFWERVDMIKAAINRGRLDVLPFLIPTNTALTTVLLFRDHKQLATLLEAFIDNWRPHIALDEDEVLWSLKEYIRLQMEGARGDEVRRWERVWPILHRLMDRLQVQRLVVDQWAMRGTALELVERIPRVGTPEQPIGTREALDAFMQKKIHGIHLC